MLPKRLDDWSSPDTSLHQGCLPTRLDGDSLKLRKINLQALKRIQGFGDAVSASSSQKLNAVFITEFDLLVLSVSNDEVVKEIIIGRMSVPDGLAAWTYDFGDI